MMREVLHVFAVSFHGNGITGNGAGNLGFPP